MKISNSLKYALISFLVTIAIIILSININSEYSYVIATLVGLFSFLILILSIIGVYTSLFKNHASTKIEIFFGFTLNLFFLIFYSYLIIINI